MNTANIIKELRQQTGMNRREFSEYTKIPVRTLEDWEAGKRTPPEYIPRLLNYQLMYDKWIKNKEVHKVLFFKLFTASCCTLFTTIFKIILNATSHYSSPIMHIKYCYPKRSTLF